MRIYLVYKGNEVICVTTLPRIVYTAFSNGAEYVDLWEKEKRVQRFTSAKQFHRYLNPPRESEDEEQTGEYEW